MASRTSHIKLHPPARLFNRSLAMTLRTFPRSLHIPIAVAIPANIAPSNIQLHHPAANRRPERNVDLILKITPRLRPSRHRLAPAASKNAGENILESAASTTRTSAPTAAASSFKQIRKIKPAKINVARPTRLPPSTRKAAAKITRPRSRLPTAASISIRRSRIDAVRIKSQLIVNLPLLGIAKNIVRLGQSLKLFLRRLIPRVNVRMILASKLPKRLADIIRRRRLLYSQHTVIIFVFSLSSHLDFSIFTRLYRISLRREYPS